MLFMYTTGRKAMPEDLKHFKDHSGWNLITPEDAGTILALLVIGGIAFEALRKLASWMFG
jgi:hypothetical protein